MNEEELNSIQELIDRKILLAEVTGGLTSSDKKVIALWNYTIELQQENHQLKEEIKELEFIIGLRQKRNLIKKFDKEYDVEDKKKNPNRDYAGITPDAEEVYKRYYQLKDRIEKAIEFIENVYNSLENVDRPIMFYEEILEILKDGEENDN